MRAAIAYYRVSTQRQGQSGLGLEAQQAAVQAFAERRELTITETFTEVETGTSKRQRTEILRAIDAAKKAQALLVIAKLDRLARNVAFVSNLMESGVDFTAVDMPDANRLTVHILAAIAEHEARLISDRTKEALKAAKARGTRLGNPNGFPAEHRRRGPQVQRVRAQHDTRQALRVIRMLRQEGRSYRAIASILNADGYRARQGGYWHASQVKRVLDRARPSTTR